MLQQVVQEAQLISLPDIYIRLKALIDDPDYTMAEVALLVGSDPALAARFLRLVNSPLYRRGKAISTISHAVSMLGIQQIHDTVLSVSIADSFTDIPPELLDMRTFWQSSCFCAVLLKYLAIETGIAEPDRLFVIGLLHDIGHLLLYTTMPAQALKALETAKKLQQPLFLIEREQLGFDAAAVGGALMRAWNLPESFQRVIEGQNDPGQAGPWEVEAGLLHLSARLVTAEMWELKFGEGPVRVDPVVWQRIELVEEQCLEIKKTAAGIFQEIAASIFLS